MADKRTLITKAAIKEGMLDLLSQPAFNFITVSSLCRVAGVGRATFYTHYTGLTDVIDELSDDAVDAANRGGGEGLSSLSQLAEKSLCHVMLALFACSGAVVLALHVALIDARVV